MRKKLVSFLSVFIFVLLSCGARCAEVNELILTMGNDDVIIFDISKDSTTLKAWYEFGENRNIQSFSRSEGGLVIAMYDAKNNTVDLLNTSPF